MEDFIQKALAQRKQEKDVTDLFEKVKDLVEISRDQMSQYYDSWDKANDLSKNRRAEDTNDRRAKERKEPTKMVVPLTSAQIDTFVSFSYMLFTQREKFFEIDGIGSEDAYGAKLAESLLERDLRVSNLRGTILTQWLKNIAKYNVGIIKHGWVEDTIMEEQEVMMESSVEDEASAALGLTAPASVRTEMVPVTTFAGNKLVNVSPYRFFPDPRFPISRFQEGEFCASEDDYSVSRMKQMEAKGVVAGMEYVKEVNESVLKDRRVSVRRANKSTITTTDFKSNYIITEVDIELIPAEVTINNKPLGEEKEPVKFLVWYANDDRIIRLERQGYAHNNFLYRVGQYDVDDDEYIGQSLPDILDKLQDAITWFINSRVTSVRKVIDNKLIVDPRGIDIKALKNRDPIILLKPAAQGGDVNRFIKQLNVADVTGGNLADVAQLNSLAKEATGLNENLIGQYASGRRSASEANTVNANATARIKKICDGIWFTALAPLAEDLIANHQAFLDVEQLIKLVGEVNSMDPMAQAGISSFVSVTREDIQGKFNFAVYDGTLPSDRQRNAASLMELLEIIFKSPQMLQSMDMDEISIGLLIKEILKLKGVKNLERFSRSARQTQQPIPSGGQGTSEQMAIPTEQPQGASLGDSLMQGIA